MDANGLRSFLLAEERHFQPLPPTLRYDGQRRSLRLANQRVARRLAGASQAALLERVPQAVDEFGTRAHFDENRGQVLASGALPGTVAIYAPTVPPTDLTVGYDGILYLAVGGSIVLVDRRERWAPVEVRAAGFTAWRLTADPRGGVWALDRASKRLARLRGLPQREPGSFDADVFRPQQENPTPPRLVFLPDVDWGPAQPVALSSGPDGQLAVLCLLSTGPDTGEALLYLQRATGFTAGRRLDGARGAYSVAWVAANRLAVLVPGASEAPVYPLVELAKAGPDPVLAVGDFYPLRQHDGGPFVHGTTLPPEYPTGSGGTPLHHIPLPSFARSAETQSAGLLDSGTAQSVWHRLYLEAVLPPGCGIYVWLAASDKPIAPTDPASWYEHRFGAASDNTQGVPCGVWVPSSSELPFHPGFLPDEPEKDRAGLFTVLIQRSTRPVRALRGRYLWVRVELRSDGRKTPELFALRAYASRFSYRDRYLPELYRETAFGADAEGDPASTRGPVRSTPADFLDRMLANFEGVLTPIEDRVASAYLLTDPRTTPAEALEWLASWIGFSFDPVIPQSRRRALLAAAPELYRWRGTLRGLKLALDVASGGSVRDGRTVVIEDFRLRRTFATILGADLQGADNPLLPGLGESGNSYVGDTLFLGTEEKKEFLAVFGADLLRSTNDGGQPSEPAEDAEQAAVQQFFERLAYRVTVLVHNDISPVDLGLLRRVLELEAPAHVLPRVATARSSFVVSLASLVGIDTYLGPKQAPLPIELERSQLGAGDRVLGLPSLDPRLQGTGFNILADDRPQAAAGAPLLVSTGASLVLDASGSIAASGHRITRFHWTLLP